MFHHIPIIGVSGGIGSGKSFVASILGEMGCVVIDSDQLAREAYDRPETVATLSRWWGDAVLKNDGTINRRAVADRIFGQPSERDRLEKLLHPMIAQGRLEAMQQAVAVPGTGPVAFVWDSPLLFETGLNSQCDVVIFVDAPAEVRQARVMQKRGWTAEELVRREKSQMGLDIKRRMSNYSLVNIAVNTADAEHVRDQIQQLLPRILNEMKSAAADEHPISRK